MKKITLFLFLTANSFIGFAQIVSNSTFDTATTGWVVNGTGSTVTWDASKGFSGGGMVLTAAAAAARAQSSPNTVPSVAGDYLLTAKVKGPVGTTIQPIVFQTSNTKTGTAQTLTGNWDTVSFLATGLNATAAANVRLVAGAAGTFYIDDVYFTWQVPPGSLLTTSVVGAGSVAKSPDQPSYPLATNVTLTPTPATHWTFANWSGDLTGSTNPATVSLDGTTNKAVTANFIVDPSFDYDFKFNTDGNSEGWSGSSATATVTGGNLVVTPTNKFAKIILTPSFTIPATGHNLVAITLKNNGTNRLLRLAHSKVTTTGTDYTEIYMAPASANAGFQTYIVDLSGLEWSGNVGSIELLIRSAENLDAVFDTTTIEIDEIKFYTGTTEKLIYDFDGATSENWGMVAGNGNVIDVSSGLLTFKPLALKYAKISLAGFHINSANANAVKITLANQSTTDEQIKVTLPDLSAATVAVPLSSAEAVYDIPLAGLTGWTGDVTQLSIGFVDTDNVDNLVAVPPVLNAGKSSGGGNFIINRIEFYYNSNLSVNSVNAKTKKITLFPNPAKNIVNINSENNIASVFIYDSTGRLVLKTTDVVNNQINVSNLKSGTYFVKLKDVNNNFEDKKLLLNK